MPAPNRLDAAGAAPVFPGPLSPMPGPLFQARSPMPHRPDPDLTLPLAQPITLTRGPRSHLVIVSEIAAI